MFRVRNLIAAKSNVAFVFFSIIGAALLGSIGWKSCDTRISTGNITLSIKNLDSAGEDVEKLMFRSGSTKGTAGGKGAHYHNLYAEISAPYRHVNGLKVCEIGVDTGGSMNFWLHLFPDAASVDGLRYGRSDADLLPCQASSSCNKLKIVDADQSRLSSLEYFVKETLGSLARPSLLSDEKGWENTGWDFIVDDGSHVPTHMLLTFQTLWPYLRPGGVYVFQDVGFSYTDSPTAAVYDIPVRGGGIGFPPPGNIVEKFKQVADLTLRDWTHPDVKYTVFDEQIDRSIYSVTFAAGCIVVKKKTVGQEAIAQQAKSTARSTLKGMFSGKAAKIFNEKLSAKEKNWNSDLQH